MINDKAITLLKAFLEMEISDFSHIESKMYSEWIQFRVDKILDYLKDKKYNYLVVQSCSNMGCLVRQLILSPTGPSWDWKKGSIFVVLCPCGRNNHWGTISRESPDSIVDLTRKD